MKGKTRKIDVSRVNDAYFVNAAGVGISSELTSGLRPAVKKIFGTFAYATAVASRWRQHRPFTVEISGTLELRRSVIQVTVANGKYYGGGMAVHRDARIDDGELTVLLIEAKPLWRHLMHITNLKRGVYDFDAPFLVGSATKLHIRTRKARRIVADGEDATHTPASFEVLPKALEVFVP